MTPKINLRFAQPEDTSTIIGLIRELAKFEKLEHEFVGTEESLKKSLFSDRPECEAVLAFKDKTPIGFALFFHNYSTFLTKKGLYLEDLYVTPEARGLGVGKFLLQFLAKVALERDCGRMEWWVLDWNKNAIEFYHKLGAEPMDEWTVFRLSGESLKQLSKTKRDPTE